MTESAEPLVLAVDLGSQSVRAALFDARGRMLQLHRVRLEPGQEPQPGWLEQDPEYFWNTLCRATRAVLASADSGRLKAVAVSCQRGTVINLDARGRPLRPAINWLDRRTLAGPLTPLPLHWRLAFAAAGESSTVDYLRRQCEINWVRRHQPEVWQATHKFLFLSGYIHFRLTGAYADSAAAQVGYVPFDARRHAWASPRNWKWHAVQVESRMLPELVQAGEVLGQVQDRAAEDSGIPAGTPIVATGTDKACEALAAGCLDEDTGCLSLGTQASVLLNAQRYFEPVRLIPAFPAAIPGWYSPEVSVMRGFWMVTWFKEQFAALEQMQAERDGFDAEQLLDDLVGAVPPGSLGLMLQPFWGGGLRYPGVSARGAVVGFGDVHHKGHFYRAILEGLAYALREGRERMERRGGLRLTGLRAVGGGARSATAVQICADVMDAPVWRMECAEATALGAAISAATGAGLHRDTRAAAASMVRTSDRFEPDSSHRDLYDRLYRRVYLRLYPKLRSLYRELRDITGYPR